MSGNFSSSCIPHLQVFDECPERAYQTRIHFAVILAFNAFAGVVLLGTLIRRVRVFKPVEWNNFYTILTLLACGNFLMLLSNAFIINTDFARVPPWVIAIVMIAGGDFGMIACVYTIITWMEVLDTRTFLVYNGLKHYSKVFWTLALAHFVFTLIPSVLAGLSGEWYLLWWRILWGWYALALLSLSGLVFVYGYRTLKAMKPQQKRVFKLTLFNLIAAGSMYFVLNIIQIVLIDRIDRTPWAWHLYWIVYGGQNGLLTLIYALWSWFSAKQRIAATKEQSQQSQQSFRTSYASSTSAQSSN